MLPQFGFYTNETNELAKNEGIALSALLSESNELSIFQTKIVSNYNEFKWEAVASRHHSFGACVHFLYIGVMVYYTDQIYIKDSLQSNVPRAPEDRSIFPLIVGAG